MGPTLVTKTTAPATSDLAEIRKRLDALGVKIQQAAELVCKART